MKYEAEIQFQSMVRAYEALKTLATNLGRSCVIGDDSILDRARYFFIECYHFKDWIKKDTRIQQPKLVEEYINNNQALSLAADLCNSFKHAGLNKASRSGKQLNQINMAYSLDMPEGKGETSIQFLRNPSDGDTITVSRSKRIGEPIATAVAVLTIGGQKYHAFQLATECLNAWKRFLSANGIIFEDKPK